MEKNEKRAVVYCRVSTNTQAEEGTSLSTQGKICSEYAVTHEFEVIETFVEKGESAKTAHRTELQRLLAYCATRKNRVDAVIVYKIDRLSRNTDDYSQIRTLLKRYGIEIISTSEYFEDTAAGRFMENMIANVAQFDNDVRTERSVNGMKEAVHEGRYVWKAPMGYKNVRIGGKATIAPDQDSAPLVRLAFELIAKEGHSIEAVRRKVTKQGLRTKSGDPVSKQYFYRIMKNSLYTGRIQMLGIQQVGTFDAIISKDLFDLVQLVISGRKRPQIDRRTDRPDFPLRGFVHHPSGPSLTGSLSRGRHGGLYPYYRYIGINGCNRKRDRIEAEFVTFMNSHAVPEQLAQKIKVAMRKHLRRETRRSNDSKSQLESRLAELDKRTSLIIQKNANGIVSDSVLKQQLQLIEDETISIRRKLIKAQEAEFVPDEAMAEAERFMKNPGDAWLKADLEGKKTIQGFVFPQRVTFDGENYRTPELSSIFNVELIKEILNSTKVTLDSVKSNPFVIKYRYLVAFLVKRRKSIKIRNRDIQNYPQLEKDRTA